MIPNIGDLPVSNDEWLARYVVRKEHVRPDGTVKPDPFIPYKWVELSVTRHRGLDDQEIWAAGEDVSSELGEPLIGRADAKAEVYVQRGLRVVPAPLPKNRNHADVVGWPMDKPGQKEIALLIAREATFRPRPRSS
jgi:hypothetical protein